MRAVLATVDAIGKSVILLDEFEKSFNAGAVSGSGDSGTSSRLFGTLLNWLSEKTSTSFMVATCNNFMLLPPELIRSGRFDEKFFVDLPTKRERMDIFKVIIAKYNRDPEKFKLEELAIKSELLTGAEIDVAVQEAMLYAFDDKMREFTDKDIVRILRKTTPYAKIHEDQLRDLRNNIKGKLQPASKVYGGDENDTDNLMRELSIE